MGPPPAPAPVGALSLAQKEPTTNPLTNNNIVVSSSATRRTSGNSRPGRGSGVGGRRGVVRCLCESTDGRGEGEC